jgi:hypothetical protein
MSGDSSNDGSSSRNQWRPGEEMRSMSLLACILDSIHELRFLPKVLLVGAGVLIMGTDALAAIEEKANQSETERIATIERRMGGRIGIALFDSASGRRFEYHAGDRFPMCSTFKFLAAGSACCV